ncbi:CotY/CotZ family spore coat protein [Sporosarcina sp. G11-34]|uniref:CotY/CotZ family spore coat protein n=1 Tax=Sporosarcina sp. G11-34 TaxID=2849605 RepID=UPI0022A8D8F3|nr:CotY/CotZ family spore coat protein [Sporosarcina sp. G11-34]MCZ2258978.1 spore coat protein CotZ [Sporosarcina sp. G11-34]
MGCGRDEEVSNVRVHDNCICEVVRAIRRIQDIRDDLDCDDCRTDCFLTPLGSLVSPSRQRTNTRVFMLLNDEGDPFKAMFNSRRRGRRDNDRTAAAEQGKNRDCNSCFSVFFRVQNVFDNCCATLQVLEPRDENGRKVNLFKNGKLDFDAICDVERFEATGACITVDLKCFCAIQCVKDVHIDCDED